MAHMDRSTPDDSGTLHRPATQDRLLEQANALLDDGDSGGSARALMDPIAKDIRGNSGDNILYGTKQNDYINGGGGNDRLYGYAGNDEIHGGPGRDRINGGANTDSLWGGKGPDNFVFDAPGAADRLMDFDGGDGDTIDLQYLDANVNRAGQQDFIYMGNQNFTGRAGELIWWVYDNDTTWVLMDRNGDAQADTGLLLNRAHYFSANDFLI
jgi:Ca2+-binding RTX toxin-like protein